MDQKRILIVEDKPHNVMALCRALLHPTVGGFQVEVCPMARVALKRLEREQFALFVTDFRLLGAGGLDLMRRVRQTSPRTRIMLITAFGSPELEDQVRGLGATYLLKPFAMQDFVAAVQNVFAEEQQGERETHIVDEMGEDGSHGDAVVDDAEPKVDACEESAEAGTRLMNLDQAIAAGLIPPNVLNQE